MDLLRLIAWTVVFVLGVAVMTLWAPVDHVGALCALLIAAGSACILVAELVEQER